MDLPNAPSSTKYYTLTMSLLQETMLLEQPFVYKDPSFECSLQCSTLINPFGEEEVDSDQHKTLHSFRCQLYMLLL